MLDSSAASRGASIRSTLQMIASAFKHENLKSAFLLPGAVASRSRVVSLDVALVKDFAKLARSLGIKKQHVLKHAAVCALSFCRDQLSRCKIRTNHETQAVFALMFHPCIGLPSSIARDVTNAIARVAMNKVKTDQQMCLLGWIVQLPRRDLLGLVRPWVDHLAMSWMSRHEIDERRLNPRGPQCALRWVRMLRWACRVQERDIPRSVRPEGSYLLEHHFNSPLFSRDMDATDFVNIMYTADRYQTPPRFAHVNHEYLLDGPAKARMVKYEAKRLWRPRTRHFSTENKIILRHIATVSHLPRLQMHVHRDNTLEEAINWLASVSAVEKSRFAFAREAAVQSIRLRDLPPGTVMNNDTEEDVNRKLEEYKRSIDEEMKRELLKYNDICYEVPLEIKFAHERGVDEGGLTRHFFELIAQQACGGENPMFVRRSKTAPCVWFPGFKTEEEYIASSGLGALDESSLDRYESFGLLLGLAVKTRSRIGMRLPLVLFEHLLHRRPSPPMTLTAWSKWMSMTSFNATNMHSLAVNRAAITKRAYSWIPRVEDGIPFALRHAAKEIDPDLLKGIDALLAYDEDGDPNAVRDVFCLDHSVSLSHGCANAQAASKKSVSLQHYLPRDHGVSRSLDTTHAQSAVTGKNRYRYAFALLSFHVRGAHWKRLNAVRVGFQRITKTYHSLKKCTPSELRLVVCGEVQINADNILSSARLVGYTRSSTTITWLSEILSEFSQDELRQFYVFVTGSSTAPCGGTGENPITIQRNTAEDNRFPSSHTCFNQLLLPRYSSKGIMRSRIKSSVLLCKDFGLI